MQINSRRVLFAVVVVVVVFNAVQFWRAPQADTRIIAKKRKADKLPISDWHPQYDRQSISNSTGQL